jgi:replication factor A1
MRSRISKSGGEKMSGEMMKIGNLGTQTGKINLKVMIKSAKDVRLVNTKDGRSLKVCDYVIEDDTGSIDFSLWEDDINKVKVGSVLNIVNGYITTFKDKRKLQLGKWGKMEVLS